MLNAAESAVIRDGEERQCHFTSILPLTTDSQGGSISEGALIEPTKRTPIDFRICLEASAFLAFKHLEEPSRALVPGLSERLENCDIRFSMEFRDSEFSSIVAARHLQHVLQQPRRPVALLGSARSSVSMTVATLAAAYELPQISPSSTSADLDEKGRAPYFSRTVPTNAGDAEALVVYLKHLRVVHFGVYYPQDSFGTSFHTYLTESASRHGLKPIPISYSEDDIPQTMSSLAASDVRYIVGVFNPSTWEEVLHHAHEQGVVGEGYTWLLTESSLEFTDSAFGLDRNSQKHLATALHGAGILTVDIPPSDPLEEELEALFADSERRDDFLQHHANPEIFDDWDTPTGCDGANVYSMLAYDAMLSMGVAACETSSDLFTGPELYAQLLNTTVEGVSGTVSFDHLTGTRDAQDLSYRITNLQISPERSTDSTIRLDAVESIKVVLSSETIKEMTPFVYADNTTTAPSPYPHIEFDLNLISGGLRAAGLSLAGIIVLMCLLLMVWLYRHRSDEAVRASQPIFLAQTLVGTIVLASTIIPLSLQEPTSKRGLDISCASVPWLLSIGFVTAFSALFAKLWRLNQVFGVGTNSSRYARRTVQAIDVAMPLLVLMALNVAVLTSWTVVAPLEWVRKEVDSFDPFGRVVETFGRCEVVHNDEDEVRLEILFASLMGSLNFVALICALYQTYMARLLPPEFSEVVYIGISFVLLVEIFIIGIPIIVLTNDHPEAGFLSQSILITFVCLTILLPILAKWKQQDIYQATDPTGRRQRRWQRNALRSQTQQHTSYRTSITGLPSFRNSITKVPTFRGFANSEQRNSPTAQEDGNVTRHGTNDIARNDNVTNATDNATNDNIKEPATEDVKGNDAPPKTNPKQPKRTLSLPVEASYNPPARKLSLGSERRLSARVFGQARVRRTRDFYEQQNAASIAESKRHEMVSSVKKVLRLSSEECKNSTTKSEERCSSTKSEERNSSSSKHEDV